MIITNNNVIAENSNKYPLRIKDILSTTGRNGYLALLNARVEVARMRFECTTSFKVTKRGTVTMYVGCRYPIVEDPQAIFKEFLEEQWDSYTRLGQGFEYAPANGRFHKPRKIQYIPKSWSMDK